MSQHKPDSLAAALALNRIQAAADELRAATYATNRPVALVAEEISRRVDRARTEIHGLR